MSHLPRRCRKYLTDKGFAFSEASDNGTAAIVIDPWQLPPEKYDHDQVALLLLLPNGYPDAAPDMFYVHPWIKAHGSSNWPGAASVSLQFLGTNWQRWSRHWSDWRPGIDGIQTWLLKIRHALEMA